MAVELVACVVVEPPVKSIYVRLMEMLVALGAVAAEGTLVVELGARAVVAVAVVVSMGVFPTEHWSAQTCLGKG